MVIIKSTYAINNTTNKVNNKNEVATPYMQDEFYPTDQ